MLSKIQTIYPMVMHVAGLATLGCLTGFGIISSSEGLPLIALTIGITPAIANSTSTGS